jgi:hypothetical protein
MDKSDRDNFHMTDADIENEIVNKKKKIWVRYNDDEEELSILQSETVGDLKNKIEKKFSLGKNFLKGIRLRMKYNGQREGKLLDNDETTMRDNHVKNGSTIILGRTKNRGGNI